MLTGLFLKEKPIGAKITFQGESPTPAVQDTKKNEQQQMRRQFPKEHL